MGASNQYSTRQLGSSDERARTVGRSSSGTSLSCVAKSAAGGSPGAPVKVHPTASPRMTVKANAAAMTVLGLRAISATRSRTRRLPPVLVVAVWSRELRPAAIMDTRVRP